MAGLSAAALAAVSAVALALAPPANVVPAKTVFSKSPYMGVSCGTPNSTACDEIGLAVWLRRPAVAVDAEVGGRWLSLDDQQWSGPVRHHKRKMLAGFMHHAGLQTELGLPAHWEGQPPRDRSVRVRIDYGRGAVVETRVRVSLSPGWG